jgi:hypothetical protein
LSHCGNNLPTPTSRRTACCCLSMADYSALCMWLLLGTPSSCWDVGWIELIPLSNICVLVLHMCILGRSCSWQMIQCSFLFHYQSEQLKLWNHIHGGTFWDHVWAHLTFGMSHETMLVLKYIALYSLFCITTAWHVVGLQEEETTFRYGE